MAIAKRHCRTCTCGRRLARHVCMKCGTRKLEKYMVATGQMGAFGKERWRCKNETTCAANTNYGGGVEVVVSGVKLAAQVADEKRARGRHRFVGDHRYPQLKR